MALEAAMAMFSIGERWRKLTDSVNGGGRVGIAKGMTAAPTEGEEGNELNRNELSQGSTLYVRCLRLMRPSIGLHQQ
jgi:hypothetical protein